MKKLVIILYFLSFSIIVFGQKQDFEKKLYIELNGRTSFYEVNNRYQLLTDTVFHTNSGFYVFPEYDEIKIDDTDYLILRYPSFSNGHQSVRDQEDVVALTETLSVNTELNNQNGKLLAIKKSEFELLDKQTYYSINFFKLKNYNWSSGILTVPFKLRPAIDTLNSNITTDITLGPYFGLTKRISHTNKYYITIPFNLGLSYININNHNTTNLSNPDDINLIPGISWGSGLILQLADFNIGFVFGKDYATGIGSKWVYNNEFWYSFAIGYNFLKQ